MTRDFNLPPGVTQDDLNGEPMPVCSECGEEFNGWNGEEICDDCERDKEENEN